MPHLRWTGPGKDADLFTIVIVDRDAPNSTNPNVSPIKHMTIANVPYALLKSGFNSTSSVPTALFAYAKPGPPPSSGCHRYYALLYKQTPGVTPSMANPNDRRLWDFPTWAKNNSLIGPISINYWQTQNVNTTSAACPAPTSPIVYGRYAAQLTGADEIPATKSSATGTVFISLINNTHASGYFIAYNIHDLYAVHIHDGNSTATGGVLVAVWSAIPTTGSMKAKFSFDPSTNNVGEAISSKRSYFNLHTSAFPKGEIRGNIVPKK